MEQSEREKEVQLQRLKAEMAKMNEQNKTLNSQLQADDKILNDLELRLAEKKTHANKLEEKDQVLGTEIKTMKKELGTKTVLGRNLIGKVLLKQIDTLKVQIQTQELDSTARKLNIKTLGTNARINHLRTNQLKTFNDEKRIKIKNLQKLVDEQDKEILKLRNRTVGKLMKVDELLEQNKMIDN